jgi:hypothetical protein
LAIQCRHPVGRRGPEVFENGFRLKSAAGMTNSELRRFAAIIVWPKVDGYALAREYPSAI